MTKSKEDYLNNKVRWQCQGGIFKWLSNGELSNYGKWLTLKWGKSVKWPRSGLSDLEDEEYK